MTGFPYSMAPMATLRSYKVLYKSVRSIIHAPMPSLPLQCEANHQGRQLLELALPH